MVFWGGVPTRAEVLCALPADDPILGRFVGQLHGPEAAQPMQISIDHDGAVTATVGPKTQVSLVEVRYEDGNLEAETFGDIGAPAAAGRATDVELDLRLRDDRLTGSVTALVPGVAATTFFADLHRQ